MFCFVLVRYVYKQWNGLHKKTQVGKIIEKGKVGTSWERKKSKWKTTYKQVRILNNMIFIYCLFDLGFGLFGHLAWIPNAPKAFLVKPKYVLTYVQITLSSSKLYFTLNAKPETYILYNLRYSILLSCLIIQMLLKYELNIS